MLVGSLVPHWVKIDGTLVASDMLQVWQALRTKKEEARNRVLGMMISRAAVHLDRGEMERARELVAEICGHLEPQAVCGARMSWIYVLVSRGQTEEVAREKSAMIENWQSLKASRAEVLDGLACLPIYYGWPEMLDEGLEYIERALREAPGLITLKGTKSSLLIEKGELDEGLRLLEEVAESTASENDRAIIGYYRALAYLKKGDRTNARHLLREAAEKYPRCIVKARIEGIFWNEPEGREGSSAESLGKLE